LAPARFVLVSGRRSAQIEADVAEQFSIVLRFTMNTTRPAPLQGVHHAAYRCKDARETVRFYQQALGMDFQLAIAEDNVPSTGEPDPYMHVFLDAGNANVLAFFELPTRDDMDRDRNTPVWVQHIAFRVSSLDALMASKAHLEAMGLDVLGPTHHGIFKSIYFFDPNGHRIELAADIGTPDQMAQLKSVADDMLEEWAATKKAPRHAAWLHEKVRAES
jgi:catechol 2,3-dioxygenase-like lactoylglutathione lyase family enzyme